MPKGVEHKVSTSRLSSGVPVITYQMPKGVEHLDTPGHRPLYVLVITYQMPKGVEHASSSPTITKARGDYIPDAERR